MCVMDFIADDKTHIYVTLDFNYIPNFIFVERFSLCRCLIRFHFPLHDLFVYVLATVKESCMLICVYFVYIADAEKHALEAKTTLLLHSSFTPFLNQCKH